MSNITSNLVSTSSPTMETCAEQTHASLLQELEHSNLSKLLYEKQYLTLQELESLRKAIESQQQIQMTIKNNNPLKVHIQCRHFKSKKCSFQITYKAVVGDEAPATNQGQTTQISQFSGVSALPIAPTPSSNSAITPSSFSKISIDSSVAVAQYSSKNEGAASLKDIKRTSQTGRREETFIPATASVDPQHLQNSNNIHKSKDEFSAGASVVASLAAASTILLPAAANLDVACQQTQIGLVENCTTPSPPQQSLRNHTQSVSTNQCMSSWQQSIPPVTMLLQNFDASATMWEGENREARHYQAMNETDAPTNTNTNTTSVTNNNKDKSVVGQQNIILEDNHNDFSSDDESDSNNMVDEEQCGNIRTPTISPFVFNDASSGAIDIPYLCLDDPRDFTEQTRPIPSIQAKEAAIKAQTTPLLFKLSTYKLSHRNHPVMSDEQYTIHLAKRWLEGHQEKIERIYVELREKKGSSFKITPKIIKKQLQDSFDIDIYAKCTDKEHKRFLKKKLDNLMKAIRQKERAAHKKNPSRKESSIATEKSITIQKSKKRQTTKVQPIQQNQLTTPQQSVSTLSTAKTQIEAEIISSKIEIQTIFTEPVSEQVKSSVIEVEDSPSTAPEKDPKIDCEYSSLIQEEEEESGSPFFEPNRTTIPQPQSAPQAKINKEEWESFLEFDLLPQQRMQPAH